jgi:hypothetical protein
LASKSQVRGSRSGAEGSSRHTYTAWKGIWWIANQLPGGKEVSEPFSELGEKNAIALAGSPATFSQIFDQGFMSKVCPGY